MVSSIYEYCVLYYLLLYQISNLSFVYLFSVIDLYTSSMILNIHLYVYACAYNFVIYFHFGLYCTWLVLFVHFEINHAKRSQRLKKKIERKRNKIKKTDVEQLKRAWEWSSTRKAIVTNRIFVLDSIDCFSIFVPYFFYWYLHFWLLDFTQTNCTSLIECYIDALNFTWNRHRHHHHHYYSHCAEWEKIIKSRTANCTF